MRSEVQKILFLTTQDPSTIRAEWPYYQNWTLPECVRARGGAVYLRNWRDKSLDAETLASFDKITFLWCNNYHEHPTEFIDFLRGRLAPAQKISPSLVVANDTSVVLWNTDKAVYLPDIERAGFVIPRTSFIREMSSCCTVKDLAAAIYELRVASNRSPIVLKPSISGSSKSTYLIRDPTSLTQRDIDFLSGILVNGVDGSLIVQEFEPAIGNGEYSLVFIDGQHTHTMIKKPAKGEFKCQAEYGGVISELLPCQVPPRAQVVARKVMRYMTDTFGPVLYCRIDGVLREDSGEFVLMEIEAVEPHLWLETCNDQNVRELLYDRLLGGMQARRHEFVTLGFW